MTQKLVLQGMSVALTLAVALMLAVTLVGAASPASEYDGTTGNLLGEVDPSVTCSHNANTSNIKCPGAMGEAARACTSVGYRGPALADLLEQARLTGVTPAACL